MSPEQRKIGPYEILRTLGAGGMGEVLLAYDPRLDRRVAIKSIRGDLDAEPRRKRFRREARTAAGLSHPAIVQVFDLLTFGGLEHIVMEYVEGESLCRSLDRDGGLGVGESLRIGEALADGLAYAHRKGVVHRDLKTENVLLAKNGQPKITDFGIARLVKRSERPDDETLTREGSVLGTVRAMSPEQAQGEKAGARSDLFALGVLLYECLAGRSPFRAETTEVTLIRIVTHRQTPLVELDTAVPAPLSSLVDHLLEKDVELRPRDAGEVARRLKEVLRREEAHEDYTASLSHSTIVVPDRGTVSPSPAGGSTRSRSGSTDRSLTGGERRRTAERRQITVVAANLVGLEDSSDSLDPETLFEVIPAFQDLAGQVARKFDGYVDSALGHRLLIYFGFPRAHEAEAQRAVLAALELVARIEDLNDRFQDDAGPLALRVGIHTGLAVVRTEASGEQLTLGKVLDLALEIQSLTSPDRVTLSAATARLAEPFFILEALGSGGAEAVYEVKARRDVRHRLDSDPANLLPPIGRDRELDLLLHKWQLVEEGIGQAVLLSGEAGIGKSRLVRSFHDRLAEEDPTCHWWIAYASPHTRGSPLYPVIDLLRREIHGDPHGAGEDSLAALLSLPAGESHPRASPEKERRATLAALLGLIFRMAEERPMVFVVEDLHWVDPSTLELLGLLLDQGMASRLLVLTTFRHQFEAPWGHLSHVTQLNLNRLVAGEVELLLERLTRGHDLPDAVRHQIIARTDGVPLFVEELTKTVLESRPVWRRSTADEPLAPLAIPATLRDSLTSRLDYLGSAKDTAQLAAALGREFTPELIGAVSELDDTELGEELEQLVRSELLHKKTFPSPIYFFKHALIQDAAYESLFGEERRQIHARIARALIQDFVPIALSRPELVAHHYTEARFPAEAMEWWQKAGQAALERSNAVAEATEHFDKGLQLLRQLPEGEDKSRRELALQIARGAAFSSTLGFAAPEANQAYSRALDLCQGMGDTPELFWVLRGLLRFHSVRAMHDQALVLGKRLARMAKSYDDPLIHVAAFGALGATRFYRGQFADSLRSLRRAADAGGHGSELRAPSQSSEDPRVVNLLLTAFDLWFLGRPDAALKKSEQAVALAREISHPFSLAYALSFAASVSYLRREPARALRQAREVLALSRKGHLWWAGPAQIWIGWARALGAQDTPEEDEDEIGNIERIHRGLDDYLATGSVVLKPQMLAMLAEAEMAHGFLDEAGQSLGEALATIESTGERYFEAEIRRLRGENDFARRGAAAGEDAAVAYERALEIARSQGAKPLELRAAFSRTRLRMGADIVPLGGFKGGRDIVPLGGFKGGRDIVPLGGFKGGKDIAVLREIYDSFEEGFETPDLEAVRDFLENLD